jgi:hypothetical protein
VACLHLGYPKDVTVEWDNETKSFYLSIKERCIYDFELKDRNLEFSFSIPFPDGEGIERNDWILISDDIAVFKGARLSCSHRFLDVTKEDILKAFETVGCNVINSVPHQVQG